MDGENIPVDQEKFYLAPNILLSFFPHINPDGERFVKLYMGGKQLNTQRTMNGSDLKTNFENLNYDFGFIANDQFNDGCLTVVHNAQNSKIQVPDLTNKYLDYVFSKEQEISSGFINHVYFFLNKPIKFKYSCFEENQWNKIRVWWTADNNHESAVDHEIASLDIFFRFQENTDFNIDFTQESQKKLIKNPFVFRIFTSPENTRTHQPKVVPIAWQEIEIENLLLTDYADLRHLKNIFRINYQAMNIPNEFDERKYWIDIFRCFDYQFLQFDLEHFRKDADFLIDSVTTTISQSNMNDVDIELFESEVDPDEYATLIYLPSDNSDAVIDENDKNNTLTWKVYKRMVKLKPKRGYWWNDLKNKWEKSTNHQTLLLTSPNLIHQETNLLTTISLKTIWNLTINISNRIITRNDSFKNLLITEETEAHGNEHKIIFWLVPFSTLGNLKFTDWNELANFQWNLVEERV